MALLLLVRLFLRFLNFHQHFPHLLICNLSGRAVVDREVGGDLGALLGDLACARLDERALRGLDGRDRLFDLHGRRLAEVVRDGHGVGDRTRLDRCAAGNRRIRRGTAGQRRGHGRKQGRRCNYGREFSHE